MDGTDWRDLHRLHLLPCGTRRYPRRERRLEQLGLVIATIRERLDMDQEELAAKAEMTRPELEKIERGELDEWWGGIRLVAEAFGMTLPALMMELEHR